MIFPFQRNLLFADGSKANLNAIAKSELFLTAVLVSPYLTAFTEQSIFAAAIENIFNQSETLPNDKVAIRTIYFKGFTLWYNPRQRLLSQVNTFLTEKKGEEVAGVLNIICSCLEEQSEALQSFMTGAISRFANQVLLSKEIAKLSAQLRVYNPPIVFDTFGHLLEKVWAIHENP